MKKAMRSVVVPSLLVTAILAAAASGVSAQQELALPKPMHGLAITAAVRGEVSVLVTARPGQAAAVARTVSRLGGQVISRQSDYDFLIVRLPSSRLPELERSSAVRSVGLDRTVTLDPNDMRPPDEAQAAGAVPSSREPALSLRITRGEIRASQFTAETGNDGRGTVIAVLDTGVDPAHPALLATPSGERKLTDWQDFTGEGDVALTEERREPIPSITTRSGRYRLGRFLESQIPMGEMGSDINRNGRLDDSFGILAADPVTAGVYDTIYVDTDSDGEFADEAPLRPFSQSGDVGRFAAPAGRPPVSFVVTRIDGKGEVVNLGYDGGQHGTHVAGIAAGSGPITGVAPGARVMAIKVLTSGGSGAWSGIARGIQYAAANGADVINLSLGGLSEENDGSDPLSLLIQEVAAQNGAVFSIAAGNAGPGMNTMGMPGVAGAAITSGAFISSNTWKADYGLDVPQDGLWYFSSAGPRDDGGLKPNVVAPGTANAPIPTWAGDYAVFQGTSMAAPQTAGAAALLVGAAKAGGIRVTGAQVRSALEQSARRLPGYGWFEQGYGLIQVDAAWARLTRQLREGNLPDLISTGYDLSGHPGSGLYARGYQITPGLLPWTLGNRQIHPVNLDLTYRPGTGLTLHGLQQVSLPPLGIRAVPLLADHPAAPGVYDALVEGRARGQSAPAVQYLATVVVPHRFQAVRGHIINGITGSLGPARYARHFVQVPEGTNELTIQLTVPENKGRVRLLFYTPGGLPYGAGSPWAGAPQGPDRQSVTIPRPQPGVWEIDAYASHGSMTWNLAENRYVIDLAARGVYAVPGRLALPSAFGQQRTELLSFANSYGEIEAAITGAGFVRPEIQPAEVEDGGGMVQFFTVEEGTALIRTGIEQVSAKGALLSLALYHQDEENGWVKVGQRTNRAGVQEVERLNPAPGTYAVEVLGNKVPGGKTSLQLSRTLVKAGGDGVEPPETVVMRRFGSAWNTRVKLTTPVEPGRYTGAVLLRDGRTGKLLTVVPVDIQP